MCLGSKCGVVHCWALEPFLGLLSCSLAGGLVLPNPKLVFVLHFTYLETMGSHGLLVSGDSS